MAKRALPKEMMDWIDELPPEVQTAVRTKIESSVLADKFHHLQADHTRATQENSKYKEWAAQVQPALNWLESNRDVVSDEHWAEVANEVRSRRNGGQQLQPQFTNGNGNRSAGEISADIGRVQQDIEIVNRFLAEKDDNGEINWQAAQRALPILNEQVRRLTGELGSLPGRYQYLEKQVEDLRTSIPGILAAAEQRSKQIEEKMGMGLREMGHFTHAETQYAIRHPERVARIFEEYKTGRYDTWGDAANALYADEDRETQDNARLEQKWDTYRKEKEAALPPPQNGEGAMVSLPMSPWQRPGREAPRAAAHEQSADGAPKQRPWHARSRESRVQQDMRRVLQNPEADLTP